MTTKVDPKRKEATVMARAARVVRRIRGPRSGRSARLGNTIGAPWPAPSQPDRSPLPAQKRRARAILKRLKGRYPDIGTALDYGDGFQLIVATVMSAQTTDETVNRITPILFERYPTPADLAAANPEDVEADHLLLGVLPAEDEIDHRPGPGRWWRTSTAWFPPLSSELVTCPGWGGKRPAWSWPRPSGLPPSPSTPTSNGSARRLELTSNTDPVKIEQDLKALFPRKEWAGISMRMIQFGRDVCDARRPLCETCELNRICRWPGKAGVGATGDGRDEASARPAHFRSGRPGRRSSGR